MKTIDKIITKVDCKYGAPMGRNNVSTYEQLDESGFAGRVYDCAVPMLNDGAYDKGGAYWGIGSQLRVQYTKDLTYIKFYRN